LLQRLLLTVAKKKSGPWHPFVMVPVGPESTHAISVSTYCNVLSKVSDFKQNFGFRCRGSNHWTCEVSNHCTCELSRPYKNNNFLE